MNQRAVVFSLGLLLSGVLAMVPAQAQLFGPSDEQKAHEADQDAQLSDLKNQAQQLDGRLRDAEDKVRSLTASLSQATGANEELTHQIQELNQRIDRDQRDFAYRLCMITANQMGAASGEQGLNCDAAALTPSSPPQTGLSQDTSPGPGTLALRPPPQTYRPGATLPPLGGDTDGAQGPDAPGAPRQLGRAPGLLGTLPGGSTQMPSPPVRTAAQSGAQFNTAMNLLARAQYNDAKAQFRAYADANPDDSDLSPQALYWVGDINYVQRDYRGAMLAFAEQIKKYPQSSRGPDSMLKLGQSLLAMNQTQEGCTTLGAIRSKFPKASDGTLAAAAAARKVACR